MESAPLSILIAHCYQAPFLKRNIRCWELVSPQIWKEAHTIGKGWCELHEGPLCSLGRGPQSMDYLAFLNTITAKAFLCFLTIHLLQLYSFTLGFLVLFLFYPIEYINTSSVRSQRYWVSFFFPQIENTFFPPDDKSRTNLW